eukprot:215836_1
MAAFVNHVRRCSNVLNVSRHSYLMPTPQSIICSRLFLSNSSTQHRTRTYTYGFNQQQGQRSEMQDAMYHTTNFTVNDNEYCLFGVFDGHGHDLCAKFLENNIESYLHKNMKQNPNIKDAFQATMTQMDADFNVSNRSTRHIDIGSTACVALIDKNATVPQIYVSNVGDSRCVLVDGKANDFKVTPLSADHHPNTNEFEKQRLLALNNPKITHESIAATEYFGLTLAMSRCIGDELLKKKNKNVYMTEPDTVQYDVNDANKYLLLCTDGFRFQNDEIEAIFKQIDANAYGLKETHLNDLCYRLISYGINGTFNNGYDEEIGKCYMKVDECLGEDYEYRQKLNWMMNYFKNDVKTIGYIIKICVFDFDDDRRFAILEDLLWPYELEEGVFQKIKDLFSYETIQQRVNQLKEEDRRELETFVDWLSEARSCKGAKTMDDVSLILVKLDNDE